MNTPDSVLAAIQTLRWGRLKDLADAADVILAQNDTLDWPYVHSWCERHGSMSRLQTALDEAGLNAD